MFIPMFIKTCNLLWKIRCRENQSQLFLYAVSDVLSSPLSFFRVLRSVVLLRQNWVINHTRTLLLFHPSQRAAAELVPYTTFSRWLCKYTQNIYYVPDPRVFLGSHQPPIATRFFHCLLSRRSCSCYFPLKFTSYQCPRGFIILYKLKNLKIYVCLCVCVCVYVSCVCARARTYLFQFTRLNTIKPSYNFTGFTICVDNSVYVNIGYCIMYGIELNVFTYSNPNPVCLLTLYTQTAYCRLMTQLQLSLNTEM